ncbi:MAG: TonB-dependent receptor [Sphingomonas sp.]|nr:TonB-dependent receptor [Sphingomonas sp.]
MASAAALIAALACGPAHAQDDTSQTDETAGQEITVTGTRVQRDGYQAPTPLTVVGAEQIQASTSTNAADFVNALPQLSGSATPANSNSAISSGLAGLNALNLRNLGASRTLVLLDGQRSVSSSLTGVVDINTFPQALIERVEVVTGGASAAYGSDALSGVVNFILDKKFTGLKGEVGGGVTTYGDDRSWNVSLAGGFGFAGGRGHVLVSGELAHVDGIYGTGDRKWNKTGTFIVDTNPAYVAGNGQPERLVASGVQIDTATAGGIITSTTLRGTAFGPGGSSYNFVYGSATKDPWTIGGNWQANQLNETVTLDSPEDRKGLFGRVSFDVTDDINLYVQGSWNRDHVINSSSEQYHLGDLTIKADNAFLPQAIRDQAALLHIASFSYGKMITDLPARGTDNERTVQRYVVGGEGHVQLFGSPWAWNAYYQRGTTDSSQTLPAITNNTRFANAIDAVYSNGQIVCRSTLTAPTNGCVPLNIFGTGVASPAAIAYVIGAPHRDETYTQDVASFSITGEPFSTWAGPVSIATGAEWRRETVDGVVDPIYSSGWRNGNFLVSKGAYDVKEAFLEVVVPLAKDLPFAHSLEFNGAVRGTDYSTSGYVTTWKAGGTWEPVPDIRFRATRSRDIRAPNLSDLYTAGVANSSTVRDPTRGNAVTAYTGLKIGNPNLTPEIADTLGLGVVLQPSFIPGFNASVDYYNIDIKDAIGSITPQETVDYCFAGNTTACAAITRGTNSGGQPIFTQILRQPFNLVSQTARGIDFEASYVRPLDSIFAGAPGKVSIRALATHYLKNYTNNGISPPTDTVGSNGDAGPPNWRYTVNLNYSTDSIGVTLAGRGVSSGTIDNMYIECTSNCPATSVAHPTISSNYLPGAFYVDLSLVYKFRLGGGTRVQAFFNVKNLANKDPAIVPRDAAGGGFFAYAANPTLYDTLGRTFRAGIRFEM